MNHSRLLPILAALALAGSNGVSHAMVPSASNSTTPAIVRLVGSSANAPDAPAGSFLVVVRDLANNPRAGATVVLDLSQCPDAVICADQEDAAASVNCAAKTVTKVADGNGQVSFTLVGGSTGAGHASTTAAAARIIANGVLIRIAAFAAFDLDGSGGVGAGDLSVWFGDFGSGQPYERSDFDGSGTIGANDLSAWLDVFGAGGSVQSCGASCP
jgi:hypothetical protein